MSTRPGPWLRLTAIAAAAGVAVVVATGAWGLAHESTVLVTLALARGAALTARWRTRTARICSGRPAASFFLFSVAGLVALADAPDLAPRGARRRGARGRRRRTAVVFRGGVPVAAAPWRDYLTLTKPRIMVLLLITGAGGMVVGAGGLPSLGLMLATLGGLALACGGASALNHVLDADIDQHMKRTATRARRLRPRAAGAGARVRARALRALVRRPHELRQRPRRAARPGREPLLRPRLHALAEADDAAEHRHRRRSGRRAPARRLRAATGNLTLPAFALFLIVFFWTPPHFWALALLIKRDYEAAGMPMLPVVRGERETARSIVLYSFVLVGVTLLPVLGRTLGAVYLVGAAVLGLAFLGLALALQRQTTPVRARRLFSYSLAYLALLFVAMAIDPVLV